MNIAALTQQFFNEIVGNRIEIYNEFSFQHELGIFLRNKLPDSKIQFERNVSYFNAAKSDFIKKEIDVTIFKNTKDLDCAIELKYPRNGQVPESIFSFCKDIKFLEQLIKLGFKSAYFIVVADDPLFYSGSANGIYGFFRGSKTITGEIRKPTGKRIRSLI